MTSNQGAQRQGAALPLTTCASRKSLCLFGLVMLATTTTSHAQSTVEIFGTMDLNVSYLKTGSRSTTAMDQGGNLIPSRFGLRGIEDLGNGLQAGFWLESATLPDSGKNQGGLWHRRSTVSLRSLQYGELRLGRDYAPTFWNVSQFAPFGTVGVGGSANIIEGWPFGVGGMGTLVRANNSVGYHLPKNSLGVYGQLMYAAAEGLDGTQTTGGRIGWARGAFDIALAYSQVPAGGQQNRTSTLGASYDFGFLKLMGYVLNMKGAQDRQTNLLIGTTVPLGKGTLRASIAQSNRNGVGVSADDAQQAALGYVYPLSKRTALYGTYSHIRNQGNAVYVVSGEASPPANPGDTSKGLQLGISHNF